MLYIWTDVVQWINTVHIHNQSTTSLNLLSLPRQTNHIMSGVAQGVKDFLKGTHKPDSTEVSIFFPRPTCCCTSTNSSLSRSAQRSLLKLWKNMSDLKNTPSPQRPSTVRGTSTTTRYVRISLVGLKDDPCSPPIAPSPTYRGQADPSDSTHPHDRPCRRP